MRDNLDLSLNSYPHPRKTNKNPNTVYCHSDVCHENNIVLSPSCHLCKVCPSDHSLPRFSCAAAVLGGPVPSPSRTETRVTLTHWMTKESNSRTSALLPVKQFTPGKEMNNKNTNLTPTLMAENQPLRGRDVKNP